MQEINEINSKPSARYALALFSLCKEDKTDNEIEKQVRNLLEILKSDNGLNAFLRNPTYSSTDQESVFGIISKKLKLPQYLHNTVCLMIRKGRGYDLVNFSEDFLNLCSASRNELTVHIRTAKKVSIVKIEELKKSIEKITKRVVRLESESDPNIIAGLELKVGSFLFNSSINSKLESMKNILKRG
ncbi:ATP synthase F1 subunit delta [Paracoccaceae bacterium]|nr:ATP synthase F1 subunit delta [Paracoccaceae bacterium]